MKHKKITDVAEIDANHKMRVNTARRRTDGIRLWFVSFATSPVADGEQQVGYYQNYYKEPNNYDILDTYNNFLELLRRAG